MTDILDLPKGSTELSKDRRQIEAIYFLNGDTGYSLGMVGMGTVTGIEAYDENGQMAPIPWVAVYINEKLAVRIPANAVSIHYNTGGQK